MLWAAPLVGVGCADPVDVMDDAGVSLDAAPEDAGFLDAEPTDAVPEDGGFPDAEPMDAEPMDAQPMDAGRRLKVQATGFVPAVGTSSNAARRVQGAISSPTGGESSNTRRRVRSVIGAPRLRN